MAWSQLADMAMTPEERADWGVPSAAADAPEYPYGLRVCLTDGELEKLGLDVRDAEIGDMIDMRAFGIVTSISSNQKSDGTACCRVEIQIQKLALESEMGEDEE
jgi:hypothetical protein